MYLVCNPQVLVIFLLLFGGNFSYGDARSCITGCLNKGFNSYTFILPKDIVLKYTHCRKDTSTSNRLMWYKWTKVNSKRCIQRFFYCRLSTTPTVPEPSKISKKLNHVIWCICFVTYMFIGPCQLFANGGWYSLKDVWNVVI